MEDLNKSGQESVQPVKLTQISNEPAVNTTNNFANNTQFNEQNQQYTKYQNQQNIQFLDREVYFAELRQKHDRQRRFGIEYFRKIWFVPLIFGALLPFCLYKNENGIFWVVFMAAALFLVHVVANRLSGGTIDEYEKVDYLKRDRSKFSIFCKVMLMALTVLICTTMSNEITAYSMLLMLAITLLYLWNVFAPKENSDLLNTIRMLFLSFFAPLVKLPDPISDMSHYFKQKKTEEIEGTSKNETGRAVALGLLISIPVLIIVIALLAQADLVFGRAVKRFTDLFSVNKIDDIFFITVYVIVGIWFSYCVVSWLIDDNQYYTEKNSKEKHRAVSAIAFSVPLTMVYIIFILIQLIFLLGHFELPKGMTYSKYAHEGFYQLLAVAIINLAIILIIQYFFEENRVLKTVLIIISVCTYGMIFSSADRMLMYIRAYGMTFQRIFVLLFLLILSMWLGAAVVKINKPEISVMRFCIVIATILFTAFGFSHPDYYMAKYDIAKWNSEGISEEDYLIAEENFDNYYLDSLEHEYPGIEDEEIINKYSFVLTSLSYDAVTAAENDKLREKLQKSYHSMDSLYPPVNSSSLVSDEEPSTFQRIRNFNFSRYIAEKSVK